MADPNGAEAGKAFLAENTGKEGDGAGGWDEAFLDEWLGDRANRVDESEGDRLRRIAWRSSSSSTTTTAGSLGSQRKTSVPLLWSGACTTPRTGRCRRSLRGSEA